MVLNRQFFSFGNFQTWLEGFGQSDGFKRTQGRGFREKLSLLCAEAEIPGTSFQTSLAVGHHQGIQEEFPNLRTFPPLNLTFYVDADHVVLEIFESCHAECISAHNFGATLAVTEMQPCPPCARYAKAVPSSPER